MSILAILDKLASNNSRNFKIETLTAYKNDELLKTVIQLALDPFTNFYQRKIPAYTPAQSNQADTLSSVIPSLAMLSTRQVTGHAAIEYLTKLLSSLTADDAQVLERIVLKDLKCGFAASTTNSVWPGMISEYPVMLCSQFDQKLVGKFKWPAAVQLKMDGMRFNAIEEAEIIFKRYLDQGQEGIILKDLNGPWEDKRAKHQIKFKGELECDLKIVGLQEGTGKYAGMLGAVLCESADGIVKTSVGSGFSDDQRKTLGPEIIGKVMAIKYNMRIRNKQGEESLFLPIVLEIREDKTVADSSQDIK
jgi:hypothetical protein